MRPPDMLRFLHVPVVGRHEVGWTGPWPPPAKMTLAVGTQSGMVKVLERGQTDPALLADLEAAPTILVVDFALRNASQLPDDFDSPHLFRGAEYEVVA